MKKLSDRDNRLGGYVKLMDGVIIIRKKWLKYVKPNDSITMTFETYHPLGT